MPRSESGKNFLSAMSRSAPLSPESRGAQVPELRWFYLILLTIVGLGLFFLGLGVPGLMDPDEGRYAEIAREMLLLRDWLIPHLNLVPYLEKPPLVYWLTSLSFAAFGFAEWAARLPAALAALAGMYLAYGLGRALWGESQGFWGAMVLATCGGYLVLARLLTLDMVFSVFLNLGIALGYWALSRERRHLWPWAYLSLALAVLVKGPVALVLVGLIWGLTASLRGRQALRDLMQPGSWVLLVVMVLPWFLYVSWRFPDFFRFFLWEHHVERYLNGAFYHAEPWWYFGPVLLGLLLPWTGLVPWAVSRRAPHNPNDRLFLIIWASAVLAFFSVSRGKLVPYILPALLPLALLVGEALAAIPSKIPDVKSAPGFRISLVLWALTGWLLVVLYFRPFQAIKPLLHQGAVIEPYLTICLVILALIPTLVLLLQRLEVLLVGALLLGALLPLGMERLALERSPKEVGLRLRNHWQPGAALVGVYLYSQGLSFYSRQIFHLLEFRTELRFGQKLAPESHLVFKNIDEMEAFCASRSQVFFYVKPKDFSRLKMRLPREYEILAQQKDCLLVNSLRKYPQ